MNASVELLEQRVSALEAEMQVMRHALLTLPSEETSAQRGERLIREARASQPAISAGLAELLEKFGIPRDFKPTSLEEMRRQMIAEGIKPEDCELSREIIRMREE